MQRWLLELPWPAAIFLCLTLGLAPYAPPHLFEKLGMLGRGQLRRPIDWFDLFLHASPWLIAIAKGLLALKKP
jgi:hypothetical protein